MHRLPHPPRHAQALALKDVWFVTYSTLIAWLEAPVPASQMAAWLQCRPVDFAAEGAGGGALAIRHGGGAAGAQQ